MPNYREGSGGAGDQSSDSTSGWQEDENLPLVIVSGHGRHTAASRRIVRAQAARASAAQSRETRARNREDRQLRTASSPSGSQLIGRFQDEATSPTFSQHAIEEPLAPLTYWLINVLGVSGTQSRQESQVVQMPTMSMPPGRGLAEAQSHDLVFRQLPLAMPRGFAMIRNRPGLSAQLLNDITRAACFDFASPGGQQRLHSLLSDIVNTTSQSNLGVLGHLIRLGCICVTVFQAQRADGLHIDYDRRYDFGLEAAWRECTTLDVTSFANHDEAEAALWSIMILSVTAAPSGTYHPTLPRLLQDLRLDRWETVRELLIRFIFPVSFLDQPCRALYDNSRSQ